VRILGAILAGGRSTRFGSDKSQALLGEKTLTEHARSSLADHVVETVVIGPGGVEDAPRAGLGPLGGLAGALRYASSRGFDAVLLTACDIPSIPVELKLSLIADAPAYLEMAPVVGCWPCRLSGELELFLGGEDRSVRAWARHCRATAVASAAILNINYRHELASAQRTTSVS